MWYYPLLLISKLSAYVNKVFPKNLMINPKSTKINWKVVKNWSMSQLKNCCKTIHRNGDMKTSTPYKF